MSLMELYTLATNTWWIIPAGICSVISIGAIIFGYVNEKRNKFEIAMILFIISLIPNILIMMCSDAYHEYKTKNERAKIFYHDCLKTPFEVKHSHFNGERFDILLENKNMKHEIIDANITSPENLPKVGEKWFLKLNGSELELDRRQEDKMKQNE